MVLHEGYREGEQHPLWLRLPIHPTSTLRTFHILPTSAPHPPHILPTSASHPPHILPTSGPHPHPELTMNLL